jgi:hypothetical protein
MTYQIIENFAAGLDTRKSPLTSPAGTLTRLINATITPGGEIAKRRAFVQVASVPGTFGLAATATNLYVFGRNVQPAEPALGVPGVTLKGLKVPYSAPNLVQTDFDVFDGLVYLATHDPGVAYRHFYVNAAAPTTMVETEGTNKGQYVRTFQTKMYSVLGKTLHFSKIGDPKLWVPEATVPANVGAGYINISLQDADSETLTSLEVYYDKLAIFSSEAVQIWTMDPDQLKNNFDQLLRGTGTNGPRSPLQYGNGDVLYLDESGLRSLKAKDSSNSASVSDIGSPVDPTILALKASKGTAYMNSAISLLEPSVGRFWMVFPDQILVLSYFPGPKITAWSVFTLPFVMQHAVTCGGYIFIRDTVDRIWVYGGTAGTSYDNCGVEVRLPYLDGKKPGHKKMFRAFDATLSGTWRIAVSYDFNSPDAEETIDTISVPTWNMGAHEVEGYDSHFSLRFYNTDALAATISNCAIHYEMADAEA